MEDNNESFCKRTLFNTRFPFSTLVCWLEFFFFKVSDTLLKVRVWQVEWNGITVSAFEVSAAGRVHTLVRWSKVMFPMLYFFWNRKEIGLKCWRVIFWIKTLSMTVLSEERCWMETFLKWTPIGHTVAWIFSIDIMTGALPSEVKSFICFLIHPGKMM